MPHNTLHSPIPDPGAPPARCKCVWVWWWLVPGLFTLWLWLWLWLHPDGTNTQQTRARSLLQQADAALARGHLSAPDGSGARELYAAAQAIDPDLPEARQGQVQAGLAALARAGQLLAHGEISAAQQDLELARQLQVPRTEWEAVAGLLARHALEQVSLDVLLERAQAARTQGWLSDVPPEFSDQSAALPLYQHILTLSPGHAAALRGREDVLSELLEQARAQLRVGNLEAAAAAITTAQMHDPGHIDLPDTLARFTEERAGVQRQAAGLLAQGQVEAAIDNWRRLLALDPDDPEAQADMERAVHVLAEHAITQAQALQFTEAVRSLQRARDISPSSPAIHAAELHITRAQQGRQQAAPLMSLQATGDCFEAGLAANNLGRARECLDAGRAQGETGSILATRHRQLALRWIAIGEERLGGGNLPAATAALHAAREIDPATPELQAFTRRLDAARR